MPGIMARQIYGDQLARPDAAFPTLIKNLIPAGVRGFMLAAIAGAVISSLGSMMNSAATIFTMDVYRRLVAPQASQKQLVLAGRVVTLLCMIVGCLLAPMLENPKFGGVFNYIQNFQGYIWPGVVAAFAVGLLVPQAPGSAGVAALVSGPAIYWLFQTFAPNVHFLLQVALTFQLVLLIMGLITFWKPLPEPRRLPERSDLDLRTQPVVIACGLATIAAVIVFFVVFR
jgi:SSS family solute:Na+ symporter